MTLSPHLSHKLSRLPKNYKGLESNGAADVCTITPRLTKTATRERKIAMASEDNTPSGVAGQSWQSIGELAKRILEKQGRK
jgi:hypothetical protein